MLQVAAVMPGYVFRLGLGHLAASPFGFGAPGAARRAASRRHLRLAFSASAHHDLWNFDSPSPVVLFNQVYDGKLRKGVAETCKTSWIYIDTRNPGFLFWV
jgi:hypothetical protein